MHKYICIYMNCNIRRVYAWQGHTCVCIFVTSRRVFVCISVERFFVRSCAINAHVNSYFFIYIFSLSNSVFTFFVSFFSLSLYLLSPLQLCLLARLLASFVCSGLVSANRLNARRSQNFSLRFSHFSQWILSSIVRRRFSLCAFRRIYDRLVFLSSRLNSVSSWVAIDEVHCVQKSNSPELNTWSSMPDRRLGPLSSSGVSHAVVTYIHYG